jgi:hypothetical protein
MVTARLHRCFAERRVVEDLTDTPVVLVHGLRQSGKVNPLATLDKSAISSCVSPDGASYGRTWTATPWTSR